MKSARRTGTALAATLFAAALAGSAPSGAQGAAAATQEGAERAADPVVLVVEGVGVRRSRYEAWLVDERGPELADEFARWLAVRRAAAAAGASVPEEEVRRRVAEEVRARVENAFLGDRERWERELALDDRTPGGRMEERAVELEAALAFEALERATGRPASELGAELRDAARVEPVPPRDAVDDVDGAQEAGDDGARPALLVGGEPVTRAAFGRWLRRYRGEVEARRFAEDHVLELAADEHGVVVSEAQVEERARRETDAFVESFYGGDREMWRRRLAREGRTEEDHFRQLRSKARDELRLEGLLRAERVVQEEDVRAAWRERYTARPGAAEGEEAERELLRLRWIRIDVRPPPPAPGASDEERAAALAQAREAARAEAQALAERAREGQDFALLAERRSDDPLTAPRGGAPPEDFRPADLPPELREVLAGLDAGDVGDATPSGDSFWVLEVLERRAVPFEEVADALRRELRERPPSAAEVQARRIALQRRLVFEVLPAMYAGG